MPPGAQLRSENGKSRGSVCPGGGDRAAGGPAPEPTDPVRPQASPPALGVTESLWLTSVSPSEKWAEPCHLAQTQLLVWLDVGAQGAGLSPQPFSQVLTPFVRPLLPPATPWSGPHPARGSPGRAAPWRPPRASASDLSTLTAHPPHPQPLHAAPRPPSPPTKGHRHSSTSPSLPPFLPHWRTYLEGGRGGGGVREKQRWAAFCTHPDGNRTGDRTTVN